MRMFKKGQGATEYLLMLAAVLVIVAIAIYYVTSTGGYPAVAVTASALADGDIVGLTVTTGSIPAGDWAYVVDQNPTADDANAWRTTTMDGSVALAPPTVRLENTAAGTWYVSLKHLPSGHIYFSNQAVTITK
jgi:hypothetical protein